ncbi:MAG: dihydropteroate synthase [Eubacterium sp.]|jgi:dihydropteroate synthase|nr:dihydropteroate synthase [Eubacterium sp.]
MRIGRYSFDDIRHTYVMGILNVTPDSFSDGGRHNALDAALFHAEKMIAEGADLIDIGGESTRPGYTMISEEEEIRRVAPVVQAVTERFECPVSVDTYKSKVARVVLQAGASLINDIWGLKYDKNMGAVIAEYQAACCLMHNRENAITGNFKEQLYADLEDTVSLAKEAGIREDGILLDPGVGFGKTYEQNLKVIGCLEELNRLGYPVLLGTSRKSVIGNTLDLPVDQRVEGTIVTTVFAVQKGCRFVRVHDIAENVRAIRMTEAIMYG